MLLDPTSTYELATTVHRSRIQTAAMHRVAAGALADRNRLHRRTFRSPRPPGLGR